MINPKILVLSLIFVFLLQVVNCNKKVLSKEEAEQRLSLNWKAIKEYTNGELVKTIRSEDEFNKYIVRSPRNYTIFILFNSPNPSCDVCMKVNEYYDRAALQYYSTYSYPFYSPSSSPYPSSSAFFFRVDQVYDIFLRVGAQAVPSVFYQGMTNKVGFPHKPNQFLHFQGNEENFNTYEITQFISKKTNLPISGVSKPLNYKLILIALGIAVVLIPLAYALIFHFRSKWTWFFITILVYGANMAGFVANEVQGNAWFQVNIWTGQSHFFYPSTQRQFRLEGLLASATILIGAGSLLILTERVKYIEGAFKKRFLFLTFFLILMLAFSHWMEFFSFKNTGYPFLYFYPIPYRHFYVTLMSYINPSMPPIAL